MKCCLNFSKIHAGEKKCKTLAMLSRLAQNTWAQVILPSSLVSPEVKAMSINHRTQVMLKSNYHGDTTERAGSVRGDRRS